MGLFMLLILELLFIVVLVMILFMVYRNERISSRDLVSRAKIEEYWNGKERRHHVRFKKALEVTYSVEKKSGLNSSKTVDISEGGVKLLLDEKLSEGTMINLHIVLPNSKKILDVEGEIVWSSESQETDASNKRFFYSGIRFFAMRKPSGTILIDYIRSLEPVS